MQRCVITGQALGLRSIVSSFSNNPPATYCHYVAGELLNDLAARRVPRLRFDLRGQCGYVRIGNDLVTGIPDFDDDNPTVLKDSQNPVFCLHLQTPISFVTSRDMPILPNV